jgi:hypothetical protein
MMGCMRPCTRFGLRGPVCTLPHRLSASPMAVAAPRAASAGWPGGPGPHAVSVICMVQCNAGATWVRANRFKPPVRKPAAHAPQSGGTGHKSPPSRSRRCTTRWASPSARWLGTCCVRCGPACTPCLAGMLCHAGKARCMQATLDRLLQPACMLLIFVMRVDVFLSMW